MNKYFVVGVLLHVAAASSLAAAPDASQADKFRRDLRLVLSQGPVNVDDAQKRKAHQAKLQELEKRASRLFGGPSDPKFGACVNAATRLNAAWTDQVVMGTRPVAGRELALLSSASFEAGVDYAACREAIDALSPAVPQECMVTVDVTKASAKIPTRPAHCPKL